MGDIRPLSDRDRMRILNVINEAAKAYKGKIPKDCYSEPYMSRSLKRKCGECSSMGIMKGSLLRRR